MGANIMGTPSPFEVARTVSGSIGRARQGSRDTQAIDQILQQAHASNNPEVLRDSIGQILSRVSPERQGEAIKYLESRYNAIQQAGAAQRGGYDQFAPAGVQTQQVKGAQADRRYNEIVNQGKPSQSTPLGHPGQTQAQVLNPGMESPSPNVNPQNQNPNQRTGLAALNKDQLIALTGIPEYAEPAKALLREMDTDKKEDRADKRAMRQETLPIRTEIANKANAARQGIYNKRNLMNIIDQGNLDDPTYAVIAENLPFDLGKRLLSEDTVVYKAGLVDEFKDLRNIFQGQTRVKEIDLLENKLADTYLTDSQKKAVLKSRINALQTDLIREKAAQQVERDFPGLGLLEFSAKVDELAAPEMEALFNSILDEQKAIINQAELKKQIPLDPVNNPEDKEILDQIYIESGANPRRAKQIADQKGYKLPKKGSI